MRMYKTWLIEVASKISCKECEATEIPCPHCHEKSIDYLYIGDEKTRIGYLQVWCNNCLNGIYISRVGIPEGVKMISFQENVDLDNIIPRYHKLTPDK